ncbi:ABC transporter [Elusimicrobium minutum Pei191]|uniref:ABC transporter n=1 Tax=Elusimicrobium minutum (strain Pei191) TaxID=445932 RepID=B2KD47_ELUMP|nr:ABC transporter transmembrane domain-containing protein [Elusimicrobium minutum]ACC98443.1 ABC transporter [Elusimicrobium minutum Pei191]
MTKEKITDSSRRIFINTFVESYKKIWPYVKPYSFRAFLALLVAIPLGSLDAVIAWFLKPYTDNVIVARDASFAIYIPLLIIGFTIVQGGLNYFSAYLNTWVGTKVSTDLGRDLYKKLLTMDTPFFDKENSGTIVQRFFSDAFNATNSLISNLRHFLSKTFSSISLVVVLFLNSWQLSLIAVIALLIAFLPIRYVRKRMKNIVNKSIVASAEAVKANNETHAGNKIISAYNLQDYQNKRYNSIMDTTFSLAIKMVQTTNWLSPVMHIVLGIGVAAVLFYSNNLIVTGKITSGNFASFLAAMLLLYTPIKTIGNNVVDIQKAFLAIERIFEIFELKTKITEVKNPVELIRVEKEISFENVSFEYEPNKPVLKDINLKTEVGQTIALVGNSGGGKSTLVNLIPRFYDVQKGSIKIDGVDIKNIRLFSLRNQISIVFQDNFLFSGTIRENILLGKLNATEEEINNAVKSAHLDHFIASLPNGLDTVIGERGTTLSGGQRQRVGIARAFIRNACIVILDEATSALDNKSEAVVQKAIDNLVKNRTVFVIAHRLSTVQNADKIIVLNEGNIVEEGKHEELLKNLNGPYYTLYNAQFKHK